MVRSLLLAALSMAAALPALAGDEDFQVPDYSSVKLTADDVGRFLKVIPELDKAFDDERLPVVEPCVRQTNMVGGSVEYLKEFKGQPNFESFAAPPAGNLMLAWVGKG